MKISPSMRKKAVRVSSLASEQPVACQDFDPSLILSKRTYFGKTLKPSLEIRFFCPERHRFERVKPSSLLLLRLAARHDAQSQARNRARAGRVAPGHQGRADLGPITSSTGTDAAPTGRDSGWLLSINTVLT